MTSLLPQTSHHPDSLINFDIIKKLKIIGNNFDKSSTYYKVKQYEPIKKRYPFPNENNTSNASKKNVQKPIPHPSSKNIFRETDSIFINIYNKLSTLQKQHHSNVTATKNDIFNNVWTYLGNHKKPFIKLKVTQKQLHNTNERINNNVQRNNKYMNCNRNVQLTCVNHSKKRNDGSYANVVPSIENEYPFQKNGVKIMDDEQIRKYIEYKDKEIELNKNKKKKNVININNTNNKNTYGRVHFMHNAALINEDHNNYLQRQSVPNAKANNISALLGKKVERNNNSPNTISTHSTPDKMSFNDYYHL